MSDFENFANIKALNPKYFYRSMMDVVALIRLYQGIPAIYMDSDRYFSIPVKSMFLQGSTHINGLTWS